MLLEDLVVLLLDEVGLGIVSGSQDELLVMSLAAIAGLVCLFSVYVLIHTVIITCQTCIVILPFESVLVFVGLDSQ